MSRLLIAGAMLFFITGVAYADPSSKCVVGGKPFVPKYAVSYRNPDAEDKAELSISVLEVAPSNAAEKKDTCEYTGTPPFAKGKRTISIFVEEPVGKKNSPTVVFHATASDNAIDEHPTVEYKAGKVRFSAKLFNDTCTAELPVVACK
jgi:hypothetical protein